MKDYNMLITLGGREFYVKSDLILAHLTHTSIIIDYSITCITMSRAEYLHVICRTEIVLHNIISHNVLHNVTLHHTMYHFIT